MILITKQSKPVSQIKKGDIVYVDGHKLRVVDHFIFMKHKDTNEMIIQLENEEGTKTYQLRYFDDQLETSLEFFYLQKGFQYFKVENIKEVSW
ncbi:MAG: hypothetical protein QW273_02935 [Candidatus Pacearchaeota archaeon]